MLKKEFSITIIVEDTLSDGQLGCEHGLALWVVYGNKKILFDTGQSDLIIKNANKIGIDLTLTEAIVLSHGHYDHTGGLPAVANIAQQAKLYLHPAALEDKYSKKTLGAKPIGVSLCVREAIDKMKMIPTTSPLEIFTDVWLTGQIPRENEFEDTGGAFYLDRLYTNPDKLIDDQAMFIRSSKGLVVILGCAHSGVVNTLEYISKITGEDKFFAVIGGMHLLNSDSDRIDKTLQSLRKFKVKKVMPLHCSGDEAVKIFRQALGDKFVQGVCGTKIDLS